MLVLLAVLVLLFVIWYNYNDKEKHGLIAKIPGPKGYPLIGNLDLFWRQNVPLTEAIFKVTSQLYEEYSHHGESKDAVLF